MTRQDIVTTLRQLATGRLPEPPPSWRVEETDGGLVIEADGARYDVEVRPSIEDRDPGRDPGRDSVDEMLEGMDDEARAAFFRDLDEAAEEAERDGPVPAEELRRSLDEAIERGLKLRERAGRRSR